MPTPELLAYKKQNPSAHGGRLSVGRRKTRRWVATRKCMHVVMRSERAKGPWCMLRRRHRTRVDHLVRDTAARYAVTLYGFQNVGNHIHIHVQAPSRRAWQSFLRVLPQRIMFAVTGAAKGRPKGKFWTLLAFSRVVQWGRQFETLVRYLRKNAKQAHAILERTGEWLDVPG